MPVWRRQRQSSAVDEREKRLRAVYGPPPVATLEACLTRRPRRRLLVLTSALVALVVLVDSVTALYLVLTPARYTAAGCWWWTARSVTDITAGSRGCIRGYVAAGGLLGNGTDPSDYRLSYVYEDPDTPIRKIDCPVVPGDWLVAR